MWKIKKGIFKKWTILKGNWNQTNVLELIKDVADEEGVNVMNTSLERSEVAGGSLTVI